MEGEHILWVYLAVKDKHWTYRYYTATKEKHHPLHLPWFYYAAPSSNFLTFTIYISETLEAITSDTASPPRKLKSLIIPLWIPRIFVYTHTHTHTHIHIIHNIYTYIYTGCPRRNGQNFGRVFLMLNYTDKLYWYNPKHLYPKLNGYGDNGQRSLKLWQLLLTYWLPNTYWNWQEYVVSVMLISLLNIKVTCEWHKAIKLNYKNTHTTVVFVLRFPST